MIYDYTIVTCGTAGHVFPALALIESLLKKNYKVALIIDNISFERFEKILNKEDYKNLSIIKTIPFYINYKSLLVLLQNIKTTWNILKASNLIIYFTSGLQIPTLITSILLNKKFILHEQDSILNKTNSIFGFFAFKIYTSFKEVKAFSFLQKKMFWKGCPVNIKSNNLIKKEDLLLGKKYIITIFAGTNGAEFIDNVISQQLLKLDNIQDYIIYHNCRKENLEKVKNFYKINNINALVNNFFENFESLYEHSDVLITRAGASTISYIKYYNRKAILIPWQNSSQNHQYFNSKLVEENNFIEVIGEDSNLFIEKIKNLLNNSQKNISLNNNFKVIKGEDYLI